ncbi:MAG: hypothetical protein IH931_02485, partial [candidate division Zixibacteria bacterium]|nr:hypothetical protein [candidate division Zixibacteria bacterium]
MEYQVCSFFGESRQSLPVGDTACKFVLVKNQKTTWLVFGPIDKYHYHAHLIEGLCNHLGLASVWVKKPDGKTYKGKITKLFTFEGIKRVESTQAVAGD